MALPSVMLGAMSWAYMSAWFSSLMRIMMMSAFRVASATVYTSKPSFSATGQLLPPLRRPMMTSQPESRRFSAWAWPWEP